MLFESRLTISACPGVERPITYRHTWKGRISSYNLKHTCRVRPPHLHLCVMTREGHRSDFIDVIAQFAY